MLYLDNPQNTLYQPLLHTSLRVIEHENLSKYSLQIFVRRRYGHNIEILYQYVKYIGRNKCGKRRPQADVFDAQDKAWKDAVLTPGLPRVAVEAGVSAFWFKYVGLDGAVVGIDTYGESAPAGVVFEVVDWEEAYLATALPWVSEQIVTLRQKFPGLKVAVVSHGREQFSLLADTELAYPEIHAGARRLISDHDVELELCLGHANMQGFNASDFPDYVTIDTAGPAQIAIYEGLGYDKVIVTIE